jgi:hypothetical protein
MHKKLLLALVTTILFTYCKKDKDPSLEGKWNLESSIVNYYVDNVLDETETSPGNGATIDFQTNGKVVIFQDGISETLPYTILPNSKVDIGGDVAEIRNLTGSSVTLYFRDDYLPDEYAEIITNLKR